MHKNWKQICKLGPVDWCLMMALAHADPKTPTGRRLMKAFPKCFSAKKESGPIPLSVLQERARELNRDYDAPEHMLADLGVLDELNIPYTKFQDPHERTSNRDHLPVLPEDVEEKCLFGSIVSFQDQEYFVAER